MNTADLQRTAVLTAKTKSGENRYNLSFPTIGEYLEIESRRMKLSNGTYSQMMRSILVSSGVAMDMIDMAATLSVLCPEIMKDLKTQSLLDLDLFDGKELMDAYNRDVKAWVDTWMGIITKATTKDEADK